MDGDGAKTSDASVVGVGERESATRLADRVDLVAMARRAAACKTRHGGRGQDDRTSDVCSRRH